MKNKKNHKKEVYFFIFKTRLKNKMIAVVKNMIASPIKGTSKVYLSARYPITDEEGLANKISKER